MSVFLIVAAAGAIVAAAVTVVAVAFLILYLYSAGIITLVKSTYFELFQYEPSEELECNEC